MFNDKRQCRMPFLTIHTLNKITKRYVAQMFLVRVFWYHLAMLSPQFGRYYCAHWQHCCCPAKIVGAFYDFVAIFISMSTLMLDFGAHKTLVVWRHHKRWLWCSWILILVWFSWIRVVAPFLFSIIVTKIAAIGVLKIGHHTYALSYITLMAK